MKPARLAQLCLILSFLVMFDQLLFWGYWFELKDFLHHEAIAASLFFFGIGLWMGVKAKRKR